MSLDRAHREGSTPTIEARIVQRCIEYAILVTWSLQQLALQAMPHRLALGLVQALALASCGATREGAGRLLDGHSQAPHLSRPLVRHHLGRGLERRLLERRLTQRAPPPALRSSRHHRRPCCRRCSPARNSPFYRFSSVTPRSGSRGCCRTSLPTSRTYQGCGRRTLSGQQIRMRRSFSRVDVDRAITCGV